MNIINILDNTSPLPSMVKGFGEQYYGVNPTLDKALEDASTNNTLERCFLLIFKNSLTLSPPLWHPICIIFISLNQKVVCGRS